MTNPAQAIRLLVTYAICIPLAIFMGYVMTEVGDRPDYTNLFFVGLVIAILASPIFIKWHYPILAFGLGCPMVVFFLKGRPPLWEVVVLLSLSISIIERTINSDRRFIRVPVMTWPLLFTAAMVYFTAEMTGGIGMKAMGGDLGGGQKYLVLFLGIGTYFALASRKIPREHRYLYIGLIYLAGLPAFISDMFPYLPSPLNCINLFFPPPSTGIDSTGAIVAPVRLAAFAVSAGVLANYLLVRYGLRGILSAQHPFRFLLFGTALILTMLGGFRTTLIGYIQIIFLLFILEGLYRTKMLLVFIGGGIVAITLLVPFADKLPYTFQRALSFLPVHVDPGAKMDADGSKLWRENMWRDTWPKVPQYLLLGKGYALHPEDFAMMGGGDFEGLGSGLDASQDGLAISMDYHSGPLSTLMPFGVWGMISYVWVALATLFVLYRNFRYGDGDLKTLNAYLLVQGIIAFFGFFFIIGSYCYDIGGLAKLAGFSVAFNWGVKSVPALKAAAQPIIRRLPSRPGKPQAQPA